ncbi:MAG: hypothetical protein GWP06_12990 [Actinobacteria bacterium]|nr:hypothetical protein [Actinomycetota bacterium]
MRRILEYASFPDLIHYPLNELKMYLPELNIDTLRTSKKRIAFIKLINPLLSESESWDDVLTKFVSPKRMNSRRGKSG